MSTTDPTKTMSTEPDNDELEDEAEQAKPSWWETASKEEVAENNQDDEQYQRRVDGYP